MHPDGTLVDGHWGVCGEKCPVLESELETELCMTVKAAKAKRSKEKIPCVFPFSAGIGNEKIEKCGR